MDPVGTLVCPDRYRQLIFGLIFVLFFFAVIFFSFFSHAYLLYSTMISVLPCRDGKPDFPFFPFFFSVFIVFLPFEKNIYHLEKILKKLKKN